MALAVLVVFAVLGLLPGAVRMAAQRRRTGNSGRRLGRGSGPRWPSLTIAAGLLLPSVAAPIAELAGLAPLASLPPMVRGGGLAVGALGMLAVLAGQVTMGDSWRQGLDPAERTALVTSGAFRLIRNPIYTAVILTAAGLAVAVPNLLSIAGLALAIIGVEIQTHRYEEPYLQRLHGPAYQAYASRTGRFLPGIGRIAAPARPSHNDQR